MFLHTYRLALWRRVDPHAKFLFIFSRSRGQPTAFVVRISSQAVAHFRPLYPLGGRETFKFKFSCSHGAIPCIHLLCKITLHPSTWPCSASRHHRLLIRSVVPFARRCTVMSSSSALHFPTLLAQSTQASHVSIALDVSFNSPPLINLLPRLTGPTSLFTFVAFCGSIDALRTRSW